MNTKRLTLLFVFISAFQLQAVASKLQFGSSHNTALTNQLIKGSSSNYHLGLLHLQGQEGGNGGDHCEMQIDKIRNDLVSWIESGNYKKVLPSSYINSKLYKKKMVDSLKKTNISCTGYGLYYRNLEKTCVNKTIGGQGEVICNFDRFVKANIINQYALIHHEFAGIAGLESNSGSPSSNYWLSAKVNDYMIMNNMSSLSQEGENSGNYAVAFVSNLNSFSARINDRYVSFKISSIKSKEIREIIKEMGLLTDSHKVVITINIPKEHCLWSLDSGRFSCSSNEQEIKVSDEEVITKSIVADKLEISTGRIGIGQKSKSIVDLNMEVNHQKVEKQLKFNNSKSFSHGSLKL